jgi:integrase
MRFMVTVKGSPMTSVTAARAAIADHLRLHISATYNPCQGRLIELMTQVLTPRAKPSTQKREMDTVLMDQIMAVLEQEAMMLRDGAAQRSIWRDRTVIMLGYHCFLRTSEAARMVRSDIMFATRRVEGKDVRVMYVYVNPMCKNDKERKGHTRCVQEQAPARHGAEIRRCMVRSMVEYLEVTGAGTTDSSPLFPKHKGGAMSADGPRGRLRYWLQRMKVPNAEEYGFHSLRAGAATAVAQAGVPEQSIKLAGNWKSDNGVRPYIRPQLEDRLRASDVLGAKRKAPEAAAAAAAGH